jgi:hypothetical protein
MVPVVPVAIWSKAIRTPRERPEGMSMNLAVRNAMRREARMWPARRRTARMTKPPVKTAPASQKQIPAH